MNTGKVESQIKAIEVQCSKLSLSVKIPGKKGQPEHEKPILRDISACFKPGRLTAIMGSSGAGKTSLLSILSGDIPKGGKVSGEILVNGVPCVGRRMKKVSAFVFQDDVLFQTMTVKEAISMSALLRLPNDIPDEVKEARVKKVIKLLGLEKAKDTKIGTPEKKGVSGGERKRTSIAMEMITDPAILFLDEPTSGLDSFTAYNVVKQLKKLSSSGKTVVATIHQPSSKTFTLFDDLLLLAEGQVAYYGPASEVIDYMSSLGHTCPSFINPADFLFMEVLNSTAHENEEEAEEKMIQITSDETLNNSLIVSWRKNQQYNNSVNEAIEILKKNPDTYIEELFTSDIIPQKSSFYTQFSFLANRIIKSILRNRMLLGSRLMRPAFVGLMIAGIFYDLPSKKGYAQTQDRISSLMFLATNEVFSPMSNSLLVFAEERTVFLREYFNGYYSILAYFFSKLALEIPQVIICPLITLTVVYPLAGLRPGFVFFLETVISMQLVSLVGSALGLMLGAVFPNFQAAMAIMPAITLPMMIFGGVQINLKGIPYLLRFMPYLSPIRWAFSAMAQIQLKDFPFSDCVPGAPCDGNQVLSAFGIDTDPTPSQNWLILLVMYVIILSMGLLFLWRATNRK